jgi:peptidoglycan/xylan/chitin deacetylase (PgdA/CDA1 family)
MTAQTYIPSSGLIGKLKRQAARRLSRTPLKVELDHPLVSFSFDDFPRSAGEAGAEILEKQGWRATYFAGGGYAGGENHLGPMYDLEDLKRLHEKGHEIACHTFSHIDISQTRLDDVEAEVDRNRAFFNEAGFEVEFESFAFPYGEASPAAKTALLKRFKVLRGVRPGINRTGSDRGLLTAVPLDGGEAGLRRALNWIAEARAKPGWLIFYGHDVREMPSEWGCTPAFLKAVCERVAEIGAQVDTIAGAIRRLDA